MTPMFWCYFYIAGNRAWQQYIFSQRLEKHLKIWSISSIVTSYLLFLNAWSGCDKTSATYGQSKIGLLKKLKQ